MKKIIKDVVVYCVDIDKALLLYSAAFVSSLVFINYYFGLNNYLENLDPIKEYCGWVMVFFSVFAFPYTYQALNNNTGVFKNPVFVLFLVLAPLLFAWKMSASIELHLSNNTDLNIYWNKVIYWPLKLLVLVTALLILWLVFDRQQPFYGLSAKGFDLRPYVWMLLIMIPLIAAASTQRDFLSVYPKLKDVSFLANNSNNGWYTLLYELSYGTDFLGIELFFRGFLILAFVKWAGKDAILPMALFYCTIHFGKPLGECISSFFGGIILGVVTYHSRSIYGGLVVHVGIAWLMELGGYISHLVQ